MSFRITITECYGERRETVLNSMKSDLDAAIMSAIRKGYGAGYNMKTGRVCIRAKET